MKILLLNILFLLGSISMSVENVHQFHLSKCSIEYSEKDKAVQITMQIFIDDMEEALAELGAEKLFLGTEKEAENADEYIQKYLTQKFNITINSKEKTPDYLGKEISEDLASFWFYMEIPKVKNIKEVTIFNAILMDIFDDQKNIINLKGPDQQTGYFMFVKGNHKETVVFK